MKRLPKKIYVYYSSDCPPCLIAVESPRDIPADEHGVRVGVYELSDAGELSVTWKLTGSKKPT